ncbi:OmpH family outer membrane protein [Candidatus Vondammii sp. HM_W22]|uniref:OmpH family outer membrane protein n=1 Tax=Candidatus Vondammii sp. HM_W22 TaxID=2687299 RepID=UPI001F13A765|nr:OmpH family outer membrane protein [Candidatus Vondammii sp. HM_W22]
MKKLVLIALIVGFLGLAGFASAADSFKIAVVNANKVVEKSPQYDAVRKALETEFERRNNDLVANQKQLKKLEEKLARDGAVMSSAEVKRLEQDIRSRRRKVKNAQDEFREDLTLRRNEEVNKLLRKVSEVVRQVGEEEGIDVILSDGIVYVSKRADMSNKVLERLKSLYKASGK